MPLECRFATGCNAPPGRLAFFAWVQDGPATTRAPGIRFILPKSRRPIDALQRQELLGLDVQPIVILDQRLDEVVDGHQR